MLRNNGETSLCAAVCAGHESVVRILVANKSNFDAVGGRLILARVICMATMEDQARILHVLLNVEGGDRQLFWARATMRYAGDRINISALELACLEGITSFHMATSYGAVRSVRLLLAAGVDSMSPDQAGHRVSEDIGITMSPSVQNPSKACAAIARSLKWAPAFRARWWTWPARVAGGACHASGDINASADDAVVLASPDPTKRSPLGVHVLPAEVWHQLVRPALSQVLSQVTSAGRRWINGHNTLGQALLLLVHLL